MTERSDGGQLAAVVILAVLVTGTGVVAGFALVNASRARRELAELRAALDLPAPAGQATPAPTAEPEQPARPKDNGRGVLTPEIVLTPTGD